MITIDHQQRLLEEDKPSVGSTDKKTVDSAVVKISRAESVDPSPKTITAT
jgi:hypothetical protein